MNATPACWFKFSNSDGLRIRFGISTKHHDAQITFKHECKVIGVFYMDFGFLWNGYYIKQVVFKLPQHFVSYLIFLFFLPDILVRIDK